MNTYHKFQFELKNVLYIMSLIKFLTINDVS